MKILKLSEEYAASAAETEAAYLSTAWSEAQIRDALGRSDTLYLAAFDGGKLCGVASCVFSAYEAMIENLAVRAESRRRGAASALLAGIEEEARRRRLSSVCLEVASRNLAAVSLYEKAGFSRVGVRRGFYRRENDDALVMVKEIDK